MGGAAAAIGALDCKQPSHLTVATASPVGTAIGWYASLAPATVEFVYFPAKKSA